MNLEDEEGIPLGPLNEIIRKFKNRQRIMNLMMFLSLPATGIAIALFLVFTVAFVGFSSMNVIVFAFLVFSACVSLVAILYIPNSFSAMVNQVEATTTRISFAITPPRGGSPEEKALNQLLRTDHCIRDVVRRKPQSVQLNSKVIGKSGKLYTFEVYIHSSNLFGRLFDTCSDMTVFVKRYDDVSPVSVASVKDVKQAVQDSLAKVGRRIPNRVLIISTSGFDEPVFEFVRSKEGVFDARFSLYLCNIELVKESVDGTFDVLSF